MGNGSGIVYTVSGATGSTWTWQPTPLDPLDIWYLGPNSDDQPHIRNFLRALRDLKVLKKEDVGQTVEDMYRFISKRVNMRENLIFQQQQEYILKMKRQHSKPIFDRRAQAAGSMKGKTYSGKRR